MVYFHTHFYNESLLFRILPHIYELVSSNILFQEYEAGWNKSREEEKRILGEQIADEENAQWSLEGQNLLVQAKRENVALQLEANYRERLITAYNEIKKRLDYQVEKQNIERRITQKNLVDWVVARVRASITPDQEKQNINRCISDLALLAKA